MKGDNAVKFATAFATENFEPTGLTDKSFIHSMNNEASFSQSPIGFDSTVDSLFILIYLFFILIKIRTFSSINCLFLTRQIRTCIFMKFSKVPGTG